MTKLGSDKRPAVARVQTFEENIYKKIENRNDLIIRKFASENGD
jgi:hypothetical protein